MSQSLKQPLKILYISRYDDITRDEIQSFWDQDVRMDDWDYMLLIEDPDGNFLTRNEPPDYSEAQLCPTIYGIHELLHGCCFNRWYRATFREIKYAVGIAYHS